MSVKDVQMLTAFVLEQEGNIPWMYKDTAGHVTVGVGKLLRDAAAAQQLRFHERLSGKAATAAEVAAEFARVAAVRPPPGGNATAWYYKAYTTLELAPGEAERALREHLQAAVAAVVRYYGQRLFDSWPAPAQVAAVDMFYNLGAAGCVAKFVKYNECMKRSDFVGAARECGRLGGGRPLVKRNEATRALFAQAAAIQERAARQNAQFDSHFRLN